RQALRPLSRLGLGAERSGRPGLVAFLVAGRAAVTVCGPAAWDGDARPDLARRDRRGPAGEWAGRGVGPRLVPRRNPRRLLRASGREGGVEGCRGRSENRYPAGGRRGAVVVRPELGTGRKAADLRGRPPAAAGRLRCR